MMVFDEKIRFCLSYSELENLYLYDLTSEEEDDVDSALEIVKKHLNDEDFELDGAEIEILETAYMLEDKYNPKDSSENEDNVDNNG